MQKLPFPARRKGEQLPDVLFHAVHVLDQVDNLRAIPPLVVVPGHQLHKRVRQRDAGGGVEDGGERAADGDSV